MVGSIQVALGAPAAGPESDPLVGSGEPRIAERRRTLRSPGGELSVGVSLTRASAEAWITGRRWHGHGCTSMLHGRDVESGSAAPRVDWPVYPRRAEHNTVAEGGIEDPPSRPQARSGVRPSRWPRSPTPRTQAGASGNRLERLDASDGDADRCQARRAGDPSQPFLCSLHSGRLRTAGPLASRTLSRPRSGHRREREAHAHRHRALSGLISRLGIIPRALRLRPRADVGRQRSNGADRR